MADKMKKAAEKVAEKVDEVKQEAAKVAEEVKPAVEKAKDEGKKTVKTAKAKVEKVAKAPKAKAEKTAEPTPVVYVQYMGAEENVEDLVASAKAAFAAEHSRTKVTDLKLYVKPEERAAYYVINEKFAGRIDF